MQSGDCCVYLHWQYRVINVTEWMFSPEHFVAVVFHCAWTDRCDVSIIVQSQGGTDKFRLDYLESAAAEPHTGNRLCVNQVIGYVLTLHSTNTTLPIDEWSQMGGSTLCISLVNSVKFATWRTTSIDQERFSILALHS